jgi:rubrerythrin
LLLQKELLSYEKYYFDEIARMLKYEDITLIIYLREEEKLSWKQIDSILNNGTDYSRKKYEAYKKEAKR